MTVVSGDVASDDRGWRRWQKAGHDVVRVAAALVLLVQAGLKIHQLSTQPVGAEEILGRGWLIFVVECKILLGLLLLSGVHRRVAWRLAVLSCVLGIGVAAYMGQAGSKTCGSFGTVAVSPWTMLAGYVVGLVALAIFRPVLRAGAGVSHYRKRVAAVVVLALAAGVPAAVAMAGYSPARLGEGGEIIGDDRLVVLAPADWVGKEFPLARYIDIGRKLMKGRWTVVLYRTQSPVCREVVRQCDRLARRSAGRKMGTRVALIAIPPFAAEAQSPVPAGTRCAVGRLSSEREWSVATPAVLGLVEGKVVFGEERQTQAREVDFSQYLEYLAIAKAVVVKVPGRKGGHHFGFVKPGAKRSVIFEVENAGEKPVRIQRVRDNCACIIVPAPPRAIAPGSSARVLVNFVAPKKKQEYSGHVAILTDRGKEFDTLLTVKASVGRPLAIKPGRLDVGTLIAGEGFRGKVAISNRGKRPVRLVYSISSGSGVLVPVPREPIPAGGALTLPVKIEAGGHAGAARKTNVQIHTDHLYQPHLDLAVRYRVSRSYRISRGTIELGDLATDEKRSVSFEVAATRKDAGKFVKKVSFVGLKGISCNASVTYADRRARISCDVVAGGKAGPVDGRVLLVLADHSRPVEVYLGGRVGSGRGRSDQP